MINAVMSISQSAVKILDPHTYPHPQLGPAPTQFQPATRNPRPLVKLNCRVTQADYSSGQKTQADFSSGQKTTGSRSSYLANYGLFQLYTTA